MLKVISGYTANAPQGAGYPVPSVPQATGSLGDDQVQTIPPIEVGTRYNAFARLAGDKDAAAQVAQTVREVSGALERAHKLVGAMQEQVQILIKNYPPFPPGSEQRLQYLKSISTLRQQLEAMNIPPLESGVEPVFYPRASDLPELDPERATDGEIVVFGQRLDSLGQRIEGGLGQLEALVGDLPAWGQIGQTTFPKDDRQAARLSRETASELPRHAIPLLLRPDGLAQMGG